MGSLGTTTWEECKDECPKLSGKSFNKGQMSIPCITSFDMNHQLLAWMTEKYGPVDTFAWIGHKDGDWVEKACQEFQDKQYKADFDGAKGCAVLVYAGTDTGATALNVPTGEITS